MIHNNQTQMEQKTEKNEYWTGPYGVLVPNNINSVVAEDGYNTTHISGKTTEIGMFNAPLMNPEIYRSHYCVLQDGNYYYSCKKTENNEYWTGPYGVLVPNNINSVVARDGYNTTHISGETTEKFMKNAPPMDAEIYKSRYCVLKDGKHYYAHKF